MNIKVNIKEVTSTINIIENDEETLKQKNAIIDKIVQDTLNHPEQGNTTRQIGEEKLKEMALELYNKEKKAEDEQMIKNLSKLSAESTAEIIKGLVKGAIELSKKL